MTNDHLPQSCATCEETDCSRHVKKKASSGITAWLLDDALPEFKAYVAREAKSGDSILAPGIAGRALIERYDWGKRANHKASLNTLLRHVAMFRVKSRSGAERQKAYLNCDDTIAKALARHLDYRAGHLVIGQNYLPWFARSGLLGGRSYDVLMTRYPFMSIHQKLDACAAHYPDSRTIADFRADSTRVETEWSALKEASRIITPHHGIAGLFPETAQLLDWRLPPASKPRQGNRIAFLGPTIARQGAYWAREAARHLAQPLIVFGADLEGPDFWKGINIERRAMHEHWLDDIGCIIHPALMTHCPRKLLKAAACGIRIYATPESGLAPHQYEPLDAFPLDAH